MMLFLDIKSAWEEIWTYLQENYFDTALSDYENLGITPTGTTLSVLVLGLFLGFFLGGVFSVYHKRFAGRVVRQLLSKNATEPSRAVEITGKEYGPRFFVRHVLQRHLVARKYIFAVKKVPETEKDGKPLPPAEPQPLTALPPRFSPEDYLYFIPEEKRISAEMRFDAEGTGILGLVIAFFVFLVAAFLLLHFLPELLSIINEVAGAFGK